MTTNPSGKYWREHLPKIVDAYLQKTGIKPLTDQLHSLGQDLEEEWPMQKIVLAVRGINCESCASSIKATRENIGPKEVNVSLKDGRAMGDISRITQKSSCTFSERTGHPHNLH